MPMPETIETISTLTNEGQYVQAFRMIGEAAAPDMDFLQSMQLSNALESLPLEALSLKPIRIAITGTSTLDQFSALLRFRLVLAGFMPEIHLAGFNTMGQSLLDPESELHAFRPDVIWIFTTYRDFMPLAGSQGDVDASAHVDEAIAPFESYWEAIRRNSSAFIIQNNCDVPADRVLGNFECNARWTRNGRYREINRELPKRMGQGGTVFDFDAMASMFGKNAWIDERYWHHSKHAFSLDAASMVAHAGARLLAGLKGQSRKCLVLDLDHTLWGGVIGDDGLEGIKLGAGAEGEAFVAFQEYVLRLKRRGVVLAVCSKNEEANARLPFEKHPDMRIRLDDIAVFMANWDNKADNIRTIADTLNLGLDSFVFIDDNPAERMLVRELLPMVEVPEIPPDPALYVRTLDRLGLFETVAFSDVDAQRGEMYKHNAQRSTLKKKFSDISDFLKDLDMVSAIGDFEDFHVPRISQLINRSNQFHLTTTRYSESEIRSLREDENRICRHFNLQDRFGDNGLICVLVLEDTGEALEIDTWAMSCRVLSRGMEHFVFNHVLELARKRGRQKIVGIYKPTPKNTIVAGLYEKLGFGKESEDRAMTRWVLETGSAPELPHYIKTKQQTTG